MRRQSFPFARAGLTALIVLAGIQGAAFAKTRLADPPARANPAGDDNQAECNGSGAGGPKNLPQDSVAMQVRISDVDGLGCYQVAVFDGTNRVGTVAQQVDGVATAREVTFNDFPIPPGCRSGRTCTIHVRQLLNADAGGCPAAPEPLGTGAAGNRYTCGDFRVSQPAPVQDAAVADAAVPLEDGAVAPPPFTPIPEPVGEAGVVQVGGLNPSDAETAGCSMTRVGANGTVFGAAGAFAAVAAGLALVVRRRRK